MGWQGRIYEIDDNASKPLVCIEWDSITLKNMPHQLIEKSEIDDLDDDLDWEEGILVNVKRISDNKKLTLPLADLESDDENSTNYQILDDYSVWFVNYR